MKLRDLAIFDFARRRCLFAGMNRLHDALATTPMHNKYWIFAGALLGYAREGKFLDHDYDLDFHFWDTDRHLFEASIATLRDAGFKPDYCYRNHAGEITEYVFRYKMGVRFEFFVAHKVNNHTRWYCYGGSLGEGIAQAEVLHEVPEFDLEEFEFYGRTWLKPAKHEDFLTNMYGDWKTPVKKYRYYQDCKAIISRKPLPGIQPWPKL